MRPSAIVARRLSGVLCLVLALSACGRENSEGGNAVAMKDLEVVDGTTTDAMTDLDGARAEGTAMAPVSNSAASAAPARAADAASQNRTEEDTEVLTDQ